MVAKKGGMGKGECAPSLFPLVLQPKLVYIQHVFSNVTIEFNQAAFIHNETEEDIRFALDTARYDGRIDEEESENKYLVIGFNRKANPVEVMYNVIDDDTINVFHAMRCRKSFLHYIKTRGEDNG
jgi:hypothetical protein